MLVVQLALSVLFRLANLCLFFKTHIKLNIPFCPTARAAKRNNNGGRLTKKFININMAATISITLAISKFNMKGKDFTVRIMITINNNKKGMFILNAIRNKIKAIIKSNTPNIFTSIKIKRR